MFHFKIMRDGTVIKKNFQISKTSNNSKSCKANVNTVKLQWKTLIVALDILIPSIPKFNFLNIYAKLCKQSFILNFT